MKPGWNRHRVHDPDALLTRWRKLCRNARVPLETLVEWEGERIHQVRTPALGDRGGLYLSAGIHGDEPAGPEALCTWAERLGPKLRDVPALIFPCLNPAALRMNMRHAPGSMDPNRAWALDDHPLVAAILETIRGRRFDLALLLHEDYDAQGIYLYEPPRRPPHWGEQIIAAGARYLPPDPRGTIEGRRTVAPGVIRRRIHPEMFRESGLPEAVLLHLNHADRSFTLETPSEFDLARRVKAHLAMMREALRLAALD